MAKIKECVISDIVSGESFRGKYAAVLSPDISNYLTASMGIYETHAAGLLKELSRWVAEHHQFNFLIPNEGMEYTIVFTSGYSIAFDNTPVLAAYMICPGWDSMLVYFSDEDVLNLVAALVETLRTDKTVE